jgi:multiple sugar transport system ATP-binding protein
LAPVTLRNLTKTFDGDGKPVLRDFSLAVNDGEFLVLLGPSGCGKTTALRCIAGLESPDAGEILIGDRDVTEVPPADRDVAMVFQNYALYPHLTVRGNIAFPLEMRRVAKAEIARRVEDAAGRLGLGALLDRRPAQLSGDQRQRVALGRAIVRAPQVFLFDEPLSDLDARLRVEMRAELLKLHRALGATMVYVTHDQVDAMTMGQRIAVLHEGRLRQLGTPVEVYQRPADVFVARFIGSPGMNILPGMAVERRGETSVDCGSFSVPITLSEYAGQVYLGVRPEYIAFCGPDQGVGNATVQMVEPLGAETLVYLDAGGQELVARLPGLVDVHGGDRVGFRFERGQLHVFDVAEARLG